MNITQNRREFLKAGLAGIAGAAAFTRRDLMAGTANSNEEKSTEAKPVYRTLGKTGLRVPIVSMGTGDTQDPALRRRRWTRASCFWPRLSITATDRMNA